MGLSKHENRITKPMKYNSIFKYRKIDKYLLYNLINNQIYLNYPQNFNDVYEGLYLDNIRKELVPDYLEFFYKYNYDKIKNDDIEFRIEFTRRYNINKYLKEFRVSCFSAINNSILMWAHYTDNYKGVCIEFDRNSEPFINARKVNYIKKPLVYDVKNKSYLDEEKFGLFMRKVTASKNYNWKYEKEFRLIEDSETEFLKYSNEAIKNIFFGARTEDYNINEIMKITKDKNIKYYIQDFKPTSYESMEFLEI